MNRRDLDLINESFLKVLEQASDDGGSDIDAEIQEKLSKLGKLYSEPKYEGPQGLRESVFVDHTGKKIVTFYTNRNDKLHNESGPAIIFHESGSKHYFENGKELSEERKAQRAKGEEYAEREKETTGISFDDADDIFT